MHCTCSLSSSEGSYNKDNGKKMPIVNFLPSYHSPWKRIKSVTSWSTIKYCGFSHTPSPRLELYHSCFMVHPPAGIMPWGLVYANSTPWVVQCTTSLMGNSPCLLNTQELSWATPPIGEAVFHPLEFPLYVLFYYESFKLWLKYGVYEFSFGFNLRLSTCIQNTSLCECLGTGWIEEWIFLGAVIR